MSTDEVLNHRAVQSMKAKALALLKSGPPGPQAGEGEQPGWRFPQAWHAAWIANQDLQREILALGGVLLPQNDKTLEYVPASTQDSPWVQNKFGSVSGVQEFRQSIKRQNDQLTALVHARQRASGQTFDECFREILSERPDLRQGGSAGFLATP